MFPKFYSCISRLNRWNDGPSHGNLLTRDQNGFKIKIHTSGGSLITRPLAINAIDAIDAEIPIQLRFFFNIFMLTVNRNLMLTRQFRRFAIHDNEGSLKKKKKRKKVMKNLWVRQSFTDSRFLLMGIRGPAARTSQNHTNKNYKLSTPGKAHERLSVKMSIPLLDTAYIFTFHSRFYSKPFLDR